MAPTATKLPGALAELERLDDIDGNLARRDEEVLVTLQRVGHRGRPQNAILRQPAVPATGQIRTVLAAISEAQGLAAREGLGADTSKLEAELAALEVRSADLSREVGAIGREHQRVQSERRMVFSDRHLDLVDNAREVAVAGHDLLERAAEAAAAVAAHRLRVRGAVQLAQVGHPGAAPGASPADVRDRKALIRSFSPWVGATPEINAVWEAIDRVVSAPRAVS
jgi:hypothetical protein